MGKRDWRETAKEAQEYRDASIARIHPAVPDVPHSSQLNATSIPGDILKDVEREITESPSEELLHRLAQGKLKCIDVTNAFLRRAAIAQKLVNCITELLPEHAQERAIYLDQYLASNGKTVGPLHGLPISVKEHIGMKGLGLNAGFASWWDHKGLDDAHVLKILWDAGCVLYARTTQPQTLMHLETSNNLYGVTVNPYNRRLTSGGSSGGEGALLGLKGSCLGLGTDIGGSIRSPAANCGLYGFRPTSYRIPVAGWAATMLSQEQIVAVLGPLSTSLEGIKLFMKTVIAAKPWLTAPSLLPLPWAEHKFFNTTIKVAVMWNDGVVQPHPPVARALTQVVDRLKSVQGIQIVDWKPYKHSEAWDIISHLYFCDGAKEEIEAIEASGEPWRPLSEFIIKENPNVRELTVPELWHWTGRREAYRTAYAKAWNETGTGDGHDSAVDVILCPVGPGAAPKLDHSKYWSYTSQWNLLDYPALVFPVTQADPSKDIWSDEFKPLSKADEANHATYQDPMEYAGAPVGLQLVGRRYEDEKTIAAMEFLIDRAGSLRDYSQI